MIARLAIVIANNKARKKYKGCNDSLFLWIFERPIKLLKEFLYHRLKINKNTITNNFYILSVVQFQFVLIRW